MSFAIPQTPQRPLPGAYLQTPSNLPSQTGQPSQPNFGLPATSQQYGSQQQGHASAQQVQESAGGQVASRSPEDLKPVERASKTINDSLLRETQYPELDSYISRKYFYSSLSTH